MLEVSNLSTRYGAHLALDAASLSVPRAEITVILGANGAGKSTLLRAIAGISEGQVSGEIRLNGTDLTGMPPDSIVEQGLALVPEGRGIFADLTVNENLLLGAYPKRARKSETQMLSTIYTLFPRLQERRKQIARTMSGGEQQMVAIGRALMSNPEILLLDEPSLGLSPILTTDLFNSLQQVRDTGIGILLVEQNAKQSLAISERGYLLENTRIIREDSASVLAADPSVQAAYLGGAGARGKGKNPQKQQQTKVVDLMQTSHNETAAGAITDNPNAQPQPQPPLAAPFSAAPTRRQTAESLSGFSIDELTEQAATVSRNAIERNPSTSTVTAKTRSNQLSPAAVVTKTTGRIPAVASQVTGRARVEQRTAASKQRQHLDSSNTHDQNITRVVNEIREAAHAARVIVSDSGEKGKDHTIQGTPNDTGDEKPVVIEVYKPPRVEVYKRRGQSGEWQRD